MIRPKDVSITADILNDWISIGCAKEAVCSRGMSTESFTRFLQTGELPAYRGTPQGYQRELLRGGKRLYYAWPFLPRIADVKPELIAGAKSFPVNWRENKETWRRNTITEALDCALPAALEDFFTTRSGVYINEESLLALAKRHLPQEYRNYLEANNLKPDPPIVNTADHRRIERAMRRHGKDKVMHLLEIALKRRGVIWFGSPAVLAQRTILSPELIYEMVFVSAKPFGRQETAGITVPSPQEREELFAATSR